MDPEDYQAVQMTRDDNAVLLNDVYFTSYNMNHHQPLTPLTPISKIVSPRLSSNLRTQLVATFATQLYPSYTSRVSDLEQKSNTVIRARN